jgi:glycosyltransferase involved in cell wall biosynthesis
MRRFLPGRQIEEKEFFVISVVLPAYNAERFLRAAIESVLNQTFRDFELIVIDDGSTDQTLAMARIFEALDSRVRVITHQNMGMGASLNEAIATAKYQWIARMDADDVMLPNRLEHQLQFVQNNPDIAVAGSWIQYIDERGRLIGKRCHPLFRRDQVQREIQGNKLLPLTHPSVLIRKSAFEAAGGYRPQFWPSDDLDLWPRIAERGFGILVQQEFLTQYRIHSDSICAARARHTLLRVRWVRECMIRRRRGEAECSWEQFLEYRKSLPLLQKIDEERKLTGRVMHKLAGVAYAERRYHMMLPTFLAAAILQPHLVWINPIWWRVRSLYSRISKRAPKKQLREKLGGNLKQAETAGA